jgi:predicted dehydrogenase
VPTLSGPIRLGLLGAARVTHYAIGEPAALVEGIELAAITARDRDRAQTFASRYGVRRVHPDYSALVEDDAIDAIYIATPPLSHLQWSRAALEAGKHVLCEKPAAMNAAETQAMVDLAARYPDQVLFIGYHWRHHPLAQMISEAVASLGSLHHVDAVFTIPLPAADDWRWNTSVGGGVMMDVGCYPVQWVIHVLGDVPKVVSAHMERSPLGDDRADATLVAQMEFQRAHGAPVTANIRADMSATSRFSTGLHVTGDNGELWVSNPLNPQLGCEFRITLGGSTSVLPVPTTPTFLHQLHAFRDAITRRTPFPTDAVDSLRTMHLIDSIYTAAGFNPR